MSGMQGFQGYFPEGYYVANTNNNNSNNNNAAGADALFDEHALYANQIQGHYYYRGATEGGYEHLHGYDGDGDGSEEEEEEEDEDEDEGQSCNDADGEYDMDDQIVLLSPSNAAEGAHMLVENAHPQAQQQQQEEGYEENANQEGVPTQEELEEWTRQKLEKLDKKITSAQSSIQKLNEKIATDRHAIDMKQAEYDREWAARNMGQYELSQILEAKKKIEAQLKKKETELTKAQNKLKACQDAESDLNFRPLETYLKDAKNTKRKRKTRDTSQSQNDPSYKLDEGDDSLSEKEGPEGRASSKKKRKNAANACRRCKVSTTSSLVRARARALVIEEKAPSTKRQGDGFQKVITN